MIKCRVYIENDDGFNDDKVYVDIELPAAPRVGEALFLSEKHQIALEEMGYGASHDIDCVKEENLKDFGFDDALLVSSVTYKSEENFMRIEITDD